MGRAALEERSVRARLGGGRGEGPRAGDDAADPGLTENQVGPLLRVVGIDGNVGGPRRQHGQDRDVQLA